MMEITLICFAIGLLAFTTGEQHQGVLGFVKPSRQGLGAPLIIGGSPADRNSHPHLISIQMRVGPSNFHLCAGSLIQFDKIVTAAHCLDLLDMNTLVAIAGDHDLASTEGLEQAQTIRSVTFHPRFNRDTFDYDFAVIRTTQPFTQTAVVNTITLSTIEPTLRDCIVSGWGSFRADGTTPPPGLLQQVSVPIVPRDQCRARYTGIAQITDRMICAGGPGRDACNGDGGSPLVCGNQLAGFVSWGIQPCAQGNFPGIYANIVSQLDFINSQ